MLFVNTESGSKTRIDAQQIDSEEDPYDLRIKKSGCWTEHVQLQDCHFNTRDFRMCTLEMQNLKKCWQLYNNSQYTE